MKASTKFEKARARCRPLLRPATRTKRRRRRRPQIVTAYHQKTSTAPGTIRFMFDGNRINPNSTASSRRAQRHTGRHQPRAVRRRRATAAAAPPAPPLAQVSDQELEDNDVVEAFPEQVGGGSRRC